MDVDAIRQRAQAATPGPWSRHGPDVWAAGLDAPLLRGRDGTSETRHQADLDAEFIAHVREDVLALLDAVSVKESEGAARET